MHLIWRHSHLIFEVWGVLQSGVTVVPWQRKDPLSGLRVSSRAWTLGANCSAAIVQVGLSISCLVAVRFVELSSVTQKCAGGVSIMQLDVDLRD